MSTSPRGGSPRRAAGRGNPGGRERAASLRRKSFERLVPHREVLTHLCAGEGVHYPDGLVHALDLRQDAAEFVAVPELRDRRAIALHEDEPGEVAAVRAERDRLEAVDTSLLLEAPGVRDGTLEDLAGSLLPPRDERAPTDEQRCLLHA